VIHVDFVGFILICIYSVFIYVGVCWFCSYLCRFM